MVAIHGSLGHVPGAPGRDPSVGLRLEAGSGGRGLSESSGAQALLPISHTEFLSPRSAGKTGKDTHKLLWEEGQGEAVET